ncbi:hypothetical protein [Staphylococcus rostri]|uniref:Uncharacterized protein n=1 Tax=Staphylococcus rostri TaxID=522262 RepID=A0A2K3YM51_9STAP|nr:hypothetical protein [Staphylococcus rostri]PNZ26683.1 hypothetical protein CD122_08010 [Staphylococcus rostri]
MSKFGFLNSYRLFKPDGNKFCLIIPTEKYFRVLGYGQYYKKFDGYYKWSDFEKFKQDHNLRTADEIKVSKLRKMQDHT